MKTYTHKLDKRGFEEELKSRQTVYVKGVAGFLNRTIIKEILSKHTKGLEGK